MWRRRGFDEWRQQSIPPPSPTPHAPPVHFVALLERHPRQFLFVTPFPFPSCRCRLRRSVLPFSIVFFFALPTPLCFSTPHNHCRLPTTTVTLHIQAQSLPNVGARTLPFFSTLGVLVLTPRRPKLPLLHRTFAHFLLPPLLLCCRVPWLRTALPHPSLLLFSRLRLTVIRE